MSDEDARAGILLFAHGSRVEEANESVHELARQVQNAGDLGYVRAAFLELAQPDLSAAISEAVEAGVEHLIVVPYFLTSGTHIQRDLPGLIERERQKHVGLPIEVSESLEGHPLMPSLILSRISSIRRKPAS
ncbi:MAG: sirohydrochlorin chelatase [Terriglobia bacterium]